MKLPNDFKNDNGDAIAVSFENIIIDNDGITAKAAAKSLINTGSGKADAFYFTLDELYLDILKSNFQSAGMKGKLGLPIFAKDTINYFSYETALDNKEGSLAYNFVIKVPENKNLEIEMWDIASISLKHGTSAKLVLGDKSGVEFNLSGSLSFTGAPDGFVQVEIPSIEVENLFFSTLPQEGDKKQASLGDIKVAGRSVFGASSPVSQGASTSQNSSTGSTNSNNNGNVGGFSLGIKNIEFTPEGNLSAGEITLPLKVVFELSLADVLKVEAIDFTLVGTAKLDQQKNLSFSIADFKGPGAIVATGDIGGLKIRGCVKLSDNEISGSIKAEIPMLGVIGVAATFGEKADAQGRFNYFNIQALYRAKTGIPLFAGIDLYGLSGGVWHHMSITSDTTNMTAGLANTKEGGTAEGRSASGDLGQTCGLPEVTGNYDFVPDRRTVLGLRFGAYFGSTGTSTTYNFDVHLTAEVKERIGLSHIGIDGNLYVMKELGKDLAEVPLKVHANLGFTWDKKQDGNEIINAGFSLSVLLEAAGNRLIYGTGESAKGQKDVAMEARFNAESLPQKWHFIMGNPQNRDDKALKIDLMKVLQIQMSSYFFAGVNSSEIPSTFPDLPEEILSILRDGTEEAEYVRADSKKNNVPNFATPNAGFGFGLYLKTDFDLDFLIFYLGGDLQLGFDVAFKEWKGGYCGTGNPNTSSWYAQGQAYVGIGMDLGVKVDLGFFSGKFSIVHLKAAAALQAGLPDPAFFTGMVGMQYSILGGMVTGRCNFKIEIGDKCPSNSPLQGIEFITDLQPDGRENASVYAQGRAAFSYPMNTSMELIDDGGKTRKYKPILEKLEIKRKNGSVVTNGFDVSQDGYSAVTKTDQKLFLNTEHVVICRVGFEQFVNGTWIKETYFQEENRNFTTERAEPLELSKDQIAYTWPFQNQRYYLKNEDRPDTPGSKGAGVIQFNRNQRDKFIPKRESNTPANVSVPAGGVVQIDSRTGNVARSEPSRIGNTPLSEEVTYSYLLRIVGPTGKVSEQVLTGFSTTNVDKVLFDLPHNLQAETIYTVMLIRQRHGGTLYQAALIPGDRRKVQGLDNVKSNLNTQNLSEEDKKLIAANSANQVNYKLPREALPANEGIIYSYSFRTSKFNTVAEKLAKVSNNSTNHVLGTEERFDAVDLTAQTGGEASPIAFTPLFRITLERTPKLESFLNQSFNSILDRVARGTFVTYHNLETLNKYNAALGAGDFPDKYKLVIQQTPVRWTNNVDGKSGIFNNSSIAKVIKADRFYEEVGGIVTRRNWDIFTSFNFPRANLNEYFNSAIHLVEPDRLLSQGEIMSSSSLSENIVSGAVPTQGISATRSQGVTFVQIVNSIAVSNQIGNSQAIPAGSQFTNTWQSVFNGTSNSTPSANASGNSPFFIQGNTQFRFSPVSAASGYTHRISDNSWWKYTTHFMETQGKINDLMKFIDPVHGNILAYNSQLSTPLGVQQVIVNYLRTPMDISSSFIMGRKTFRIGYGVNPSSSNKKTVTVGQ